MHLKNILITVSNIDRSIQFYYDLFGLMVVNNQEGGNVIMTEGLVLQDEKIWKHFMNQDIQYKNHATELYFEERDIEGFIEKLQVSPYEIEYVNELMTHEWGQKVIRFYDLDGNLIEVGTPMETRTEVR